jgi:hypothetical protein
MPETTPVAASTDAIDASDVLQLPLPVLLLRVVVVPAQTVVAPLIVPADGPVVTVTGMVAKPVPQLLVTV